MPLAANYSLVIVAYLQHARVLFPDDLVQQARWVQAQMAEFKASQPQFSGVYEQPRRSGTLDFEPVANLVSAEDGFR